LLTTWWRAAFPGSYRVDREPILAEQRGGHRDTLLHRVPESHGDAAHGGRGCARRWGFAWLPGVDPSCRISAGRKLAATMSRGKRAKWRRAVVRNSGAETNTLNAKLPSMRVAHGMTSPIQRGKAAR
jgi:hypothetical protein